MLNQYACNYCIFNIWVVNKPRLWETYCDIFYFRIREVEPIKYRQTPDNKNFRCEAENNKSFEYLWSSIFQMLLNLLGQHAADDHSLAIDPKLSITAWTDLHCGQNNRLIGQRLRCESYQRLTIWSVVGHRRNLFEKNSSCWKLIVQSLTIQRGHLQSLYPPWNDNIIKWKYSAFLFNQLNL